MAHSSASSQSHVSEGTPSPPQPPAHPTPPHPFISSAFQFYLSLPREARLSSVFQTLIKRLRRPDDKRAVTN